MFEELDRMLKLGVIEESESPWNSPVVLVRKPGKTRLCLDSRRLNSVTKKMAYGLPNINGLLSRLEDTYYISCIDLKDAFWQVKLDEESKEKTAFTVPGTSIPVRCDAVWPLQRRTEALPVNGPCFPYSTPLTCLCLFGRLVGSISYVR